MGVSNAQHDGGGARRRPAAAALRGAGGGGAWGSGSPGTAVAAHDGGCGMALRSAGGGERVGVSSIYMWTYGVIFVFRLRLQKLSLHTPTYNSKG